MSAAFRIDYVEAALLALLKSNLPTAYGSGVNIDSLGDKDFDEEGALVLEPPSVRVRFLAADYKPLRDNQRLTYQAAYPFEILCYESSLRSPADQRKQTLVLVATVEDQLAGARLTLTDSEVTFPVTVKGVTLVAQESGGVDQLFSVVVEIGGSAQFSGANANFGGQG